MFQAEEPGKQSQYKVTNVAVRMLSEGSPVQLTATKATRIDPVMPDLGEGAVRWRRSVTSIQEIVEDPDFQPRFSEVDTVGVVVKVGRVEPGKNSQARK